MLKEFNSADDDILRALVNSRLGDCKRILEDKGYKIPSCKIVYDLKGNRAGEFNPINYNIRLNLFFLHNETVTFLNRTVAHEFAHAVVRFNYFNAKSHGREWRKVMADLNVDSKRCHSYGDSPEKRKFKQFSFSCIHCNTVTFTLKMINKMRLGRRYFIKRCRCYIDLNHITEITESKGE